MNEADQEIHYKTCFFVGEWKVRSTSEVNTIWVTALHRGGLEMDMMHKSVTHGYMGQVIYVNESSDNIAIVGFATNMMMHANGTACMVLCCNISNVDPGPNISQLKPEFRDDFCYLHGELVAASFCWTTRPLIKDSPVHR